MTSKLTITREENVQAVFDLKAGYTLGLADVEILKRVARMALAAMDSEPVEMPLDYLQGHKDGLEWAAQLAEANHPETGDWLHDDPIELAKAIRKGPDMPPSQPAQVVDADDNFYSWFGREWQENYQHNQYTTAAKQMLGVMAESAWIAATERQRQKQSVSVPDVKIYEGVPYKVGRFKTHRDCYCDGWNACRAAMLQESQKSAGESNNCRSCENVQDLQAGNSPAQGGSRCSIKAAPALDSSPKTAESRCGNSPVIPDGSFSGLFNSARALLDALYEFGPDDIAISEHVTNLEDALRNAAAPQPQSAPQNIPEIIPGWIPVSERMPEDRTQVILWDAEIGEVTSGHYSHKTHTFYHCGDAIQNEITHWMLPPSAPQGVKGE